MSLARTLINSTLLAEQLESWRRYGRRCMRVLLPLYVIAVVLSLLFGLRMTYAVAHYHDFQGEALVRSLGLGLGLLEVGAIVVICYLIPVTYRLYFWLCALTFFAAVPIGLGTLAVWFVTGDDDLLQYVEWSVVSAIATAAAMAIMRFGKAIFDSYQWSEDGLDHSLYHPPKDQPIDDRTEQTVYTEYDLPWHRLEMERQARAEQEKNDRWEQEVNERHQQIRGQLYND